MLTGFVYTNLGPLVANCMITNYQDYERGDDDVEPWPEFRAWWHVLQTRCGLRGPCAGGGLGKSSLKPFRHSSGKAAPQKRSWVRQ